MPNRGAISGTGTRVTSSAALAVVVGLCACTSPDTGPTSVTTATTAITPAVCPADDTASRNLGAGIWKAVSEEFANSTTDRFRDVRAVLVSVCGQPVVQQFLGSTAQDYHVVASVTKSVVSTLVGIAQAEGAIRSLDQNLDELLPQRRRDMTPAVAAVTLRQLLTMSAGLDADHLDNSASEWELSRDFVGAILREGMQGPLGHFAYSSASSHVIAAILVQATGRPVLDYARVKLFDPLGIPSQPAAQPVLEPQSMTGYDSAGFTWPVDHQGVNIGGGWLKLTPGDMLKIGQLYLDEGRYQGRQVVPAQWVHDATTQQVETDNGFAGPGYGFHWWVTTAGADAAYAAIGFGGQVVEVVPARQLVAVFSTELLATTQFVRVDGKAFEDLVSYVVIPRLAVR
ncbi:MAG: serine hydrolase [Lapillicoccus sp.]